MARDDFAGGSGSRYLLLGSTVFLTLVGLVMIFSASSVTDVVHEGNPAYHLIRQVVALAIGLVLAVVLASFDYRRYQRAIPIIFGTIVVGLGLTFVLGVVRYGAKRWLNFAGMSIQPSEFAKIGIVIIVAALMVEWQRGRLTFGQLAGRLVLYAGLPAFLVIGQRDLGTTISIVLAAVTVMFLGGFPLRYILGAVGAGVALVVTMIIVEPYRMARVTAFLDPFAQAQGKGYQTVQALLAFGTGGISGLGLGMSRQKFFYLPEAHTDFIFAIVGEEAGLLGTLAIVAAFMVLMWAGVRIAIGSRDKFGALVAGGLVGVIGVQALMNMFAVTSLMPVTGKPLPFVSFGGTSIMATLMAVGVILSVSKYGANAPRAVGVPKPKKEKPRREGTDERRGDRGTRVSRPVRGSGARRRA